MFENLELSPRDKSIVMIMILIVIVAIIITFFSSMIVNVEAGHKGIVISGFNVGHQFDEGIHVKNPLDKVSHVRYNIQERTETISVRSEDGYNVNIDITLSYHIVENQVSNVRINNPDYVDTTIIPQMRSIARKIVSENNWTGEELNREKTFYEVELANKLRPVLEDYHIIPDAILMRNLDFPATVDTAWQNRASAEVGVQTAQFKLEEADLLAQQEIVIAESEANATIVLAYGQAEALSILAGETDSLDNGTMNYILSLKYIQMLRDPETNVQFVLVTDGNSNPFILDLSEFGEEAP